MNIIRRIFGPANKNSASIAKERLQIIVSHQRSSRESPEYLPLLQKELIDVITKYVEINKEQVNVVFEKLGDNSVLELNVTLPNKADATV